MFKKLFIAFCLVSAMDFTYADSSTEVLIKVKTENSECATEKAREYPKYKTAKWLFKAYAKAWNAGDYDLMYHLLSGNTREEWTYDKFERLLKADKAVNGGLNKFGVVKQLSDNGGSAVWNIALIYKNTGAGPKNVRVTLVKDGDYWFIRDGGLLPPDYSIFDR